MAAPIGHIFLAIQMLSGPFQGLFNEKEFIIGTSFPDIRYLKVIEGSETHFPNVSLENIMLEKNSFKAGMLFHSFVDEQREAYVVKNHFYEKIPIFRFTSQSLKFAEDEILKSLFNIKQYQPYFDEILEMEKSYNIPELHIRSWHTFLQGYFNGNYSNKDLVMKYFDLNEPNTWFIRRWFFSWFYAQKIQQTISLVTANVEMKNLILDFYQHKFYSTVLKTSERSSMKDELLLTPDEKTTVASYDANAEEWAEDHAKRLVWAEEIKRLRSYASQGKLLEIGSGGGRDARYLIESGYDYTGIDVSNGLLEVAKKNNPKGTFLKQSVYNLDFPLNSFDSFWASAILLHLPKQRISEALKQIQKVVRPGGIGFISLKKGSCEKLFEEKSRYKNELTRLFSYYEHDEFSSILKANGFEILESRITPGSHEPWLHYFVKVL